MLVTCFASCLEMWDVIWEMRFRFVLCRDCLSDSFSWSGLIISSSVFSDRLVSLLVNDACSFLIIKWRMPVLDLSSDVYDETSRLTEYLIKVRRLIKLDGSDSSNLTKKDVISSNLRSSSHQTFEKKDNLSTFWWAISCSDTWCEELSLAEDHFRFVPK
jgi:hypothetical protein